MVLPIYHGCPNLDDFLSDGSFAAIDILKPKEAVTKFEAIAREAQGEKQMAAVEEARRRLLDEHHLCAFIGHEMNSHFETLEIANGR
jgi:hypothetical protein